MGYCLAQGWVKPCSRCSQPQYPHVHTRLTATLSLLGVAISTYAKYCYHKLQKAALTGAKKVQMLPSGRSRVEQMALLWPIQKPDSVLTRKTCLNLGDPVLLYSLRACGHA